MTVKKKSTREDVLHMVVHDMKGPLAVVMANLDLLQTRRLSRGNRALLGIASRECETLHRMIQDLLETGRMKRGETELNLSMVDLGGFLCAFCEKVAPMAAERSVRLELRHECTAGPIALDAHLLERMLFNLVLNALRHARENGRIVIGTEDGSGEPAVKLYVSDDGPGIAEKDRQRIFELYHRGESPERNRERNDGLEGGPGRDRYGSGSGIGLAFCRLAAERHGGRIGVESVPGRGSTFVVHLPTGLVPSGSGLFD